MSDKGAERPQGRVLIQGWNWVPLIFPTLMLARPTWRLVGEDYGAIRGHVPAMPIQRLVEANAMVMLLMVFLVWLILGLYGVSITESGVQTCDFLARRKFIPWDDVLLVSAVSGEGIRLTSASDAVLIRWASFNFRLKRLEEIISSRLPWAVWPVTGKPVQCRPVSD